MRNTRYRSPLLQLLAYSHLPEALQAVSSPFSALAEQIDKRMADALDAFESNRRRTKQIPEGIPLLDTPLHELPEDLRAALHQSELAIQRLVDSKDAAVRVLVVLKPKPATLAAATVPPGPPDPPPAPPGRRVG